MARSAADIIAAVQPTQPSRPPVVWTHAVAEDNLVAITDDVIIVDTLPKNALATAREMLERETAPDQVLSRRPLAIRFMAVQAVQAHLNSTAVEIAYDSGGKRIVSRRVVMANSEDQAEFLAQARERMPAGCQVVETRGSRIFHALTPFHVLIVFAVLAAFAHAFFTSDAADPEGTREEILTGSSYAGAATSTAAFVTRRRVDRMLGRFLGRSRLGTLAVIAAAAVAGVLTLIGQTVSMIVLLGGVAGSLWWTIARFTNPPRTMAVVVPQRR
jgi:hypothetical protein